MSHAHRLPRTRGRIGLAMVCGLVAALCLALVPGVADAKGKGKKQGHQLTVMTRNLYLGADLTPALQATTTQGFINAAGAIVNQVHATKFPSVRAALIAKEIQKRKPDVVGIQEGAWWRTAPTNFGVASTGPSATQTDPAGGDFLTDLLGQLNTKPKNKKARKGFAPYRIAVVKNEFDFETPVNDDPSGGGLFGADHNERLTMRDAILVRKGVKAGSPSSGTFNVLLHETVAGGAATLNVTRGWAAVNIKAHSRRLHVVDTHFEAFDSQSSNTGSDGQTYPQGAIREAQAKQLVSAQPNGAVNPAVPNVILGDLNSDFPVHGDQVNPGDALAYQAVLAGGFGERSPAVPPFGCCIQDPTLANPSTAGITHRVDHIMSNSGKVKFQKGGLTHIYGNGLWSSDHAGEWSQLLIK